ncbi:MAG TPA: hypothetical protein VI316_09520, partial [Candidatus Dormibacteraeota bacterium]
MTGSDLDRTPPHRRPAVLAAALLAGLLVAALAGVGYALTRGSGGAATTEVAVVLTRYQGAPAQAIQGIRLVGGPGADLGVAATTPPVAPATTDAGVLRVTAGAYTGVRAEVGGETLQVDAHAVLRAGTLQPLLVAAGDHRMSVFWGNEALNQGLALAAGQLTRAPSVV